jgi:hypothetical protein
MDETKAAMILGQAVIELWPALPRDLQEQLFDRVKAASPDLRTELATFLHDRRPRTAHHSEA